MFPGRYTVGMGWVAYSYFARFVDDYSVYVISRPRSLSHGATIADMADGYADVISAELGQADVVGVSMGGQIGLELAIRHPDLVDQLVLADSGVRIADLDAVGRFERYARNHD